MASSYQLIKLNYPNIDAICTESNIELQHLIINITDDFGVLPLEELNHLIATIQQIRSNQDMQQLFSVIIGSYTKYQKQKCKKQYPDIDFDYNIAKEPSSDKAMHTMLGIIRFYKVFEKYIYSTNNVLDKYIINYTDYKSGFFLTKLFFLCKKLKLVLTK